MRDLGHKNLSISSTHLKEFWRLQILALGTKHKTLGKQKLITLADAVYSMASQHLG